MGSFSHISGVIKLLTRPERGRLILVTLMAIFMAIIEVVGVGSIMPFMSVAAKPEIIHTNPLLQKVYTLFGFPSELRFIIFLGVVVVCMLVITNIFQAFMQYVKVRFTSIRRHALSVRMLQGYLGLDYAFFLNRDSHEFVKNINGEVQQMINGTLMQFVDLLARFIQVVSLTTFLFFVNPISTLGITASMILIYGTIYVFVRNILAKLGKERFEMYSQIARIVSEAFWGIKEVKLNGSERTFIDEYKGPSRRIALIESKNEIIGDVPKFALETAAFSSIMLFILLTITHSGTFADVAGTVTLYAYAGYRMIPAVQGMFKGLTKLRYGAATAERIIKEFEIISAVTPLEAADPGKLPFTRELSLAHVSFSYPNTETAILDDFSVSIKANMLVGFAGKTGSGKTTLIDIILGLLHPQKGELIVDDTVLTRGTIRSWQRNLGYVPQNIFLSNQSVAANIAFGVPKRQIDSDAVTRSAKMAQIHDFIVGELKDGYETDIGERGIRLSGGQRQRIGIARALYRNPSTLIMDEATSALDGHTEKAVMEAIDTLQGTRTIILIAHRLTTLKKCDVIYLLEKGRIIDHGSYKDLEKRSAYFQENEAAPRPYL